MNLQKNLIPGKLYSVSRFRSHDDVEFSLGDNRVYLYDENQKHLSLNGILINNQIFLFLGFIKNMYYRVIHQDKIVLIGGDRILEEIPVDNTID